MTAKNFPMSISATGTNDGAEFVFIEERVEKNNKIHTLMKASQTSVNPVPNGEIDESGILPVYIKLMKTYIYAGVVTMA